MSEPSHYFVLMLSPGETQMQGEQLDASCFSLYLLMPREFLPSVSNMEDSLLPTHAKPAYNHASQQWQQQYC